MLEIKEQLLKLKKVGPDVKDAEYYYKIGELFIYKIKLIINI